MPIQQLEIFTMIKPEFPTDSPVNTIKLTGQNLEVWNLLNKHETIDKYIARELGIDELRSRISDLKNKFGKSIYSKLFTTENNLQYSKYSLKPFDK